VPAATETTHDGLLLPNETASITANIALATTALSAPSVASTTVVVNNPLPVSSVLTRTVALTGPLAGQTVVFTLTQTSPAGATTTLTATTDSNGLAMTTFSAATTAANAQYSLKANFAATTTYAAAAAATVVINAVNLTPTVLTISPLVVTSGQPSTVSAHLATNLGVPISGRALTFSIVGTGTIGTPTTNSNGDATIDWTPGIAFTGQWRADFADVATVEAPSF
jgi:hypothetical protein